MQKQTQTTTAYMDFKPYLYVKTEINGTTSLKYIDLKSNMTIQQVSEAIREHFHINLGKCIFCGNITGYTYHESITTAIEFDVCGNYLSETQTTPENNRNITTFGGLFALLTY
ncbi:MAG: hypothetical protein WCO98_04150 [bacterium]